MVIFHCTVHNAASPADNKEHTEGTWHCMFVIFHSTKHTSFSLLTLINAKKCWKQITPGVNTANASWDQDFLPILCLWLASTTKACQRDTSPHQPLRRQCRVLPLAASHRWRENSGCTENVMQRDWPKSCLWLTPDQEKKKKVIQFYTFSFPIKYESWCT